MATGNLKEVIKAIHTYVPKSTLPLPEDLVDIIQAYLDKHSPVDESDSQKIHEELLSLYQSYVKDKPDRAAGFLALLRQIKGGIRGTHRFLQWWDLLVIPVLGHLGEEKGLAVETRGILLDTLVYDADEGDTTVAAKTSAVLSEKLLEMWLRDAHVASTEADPKANFLRQQVQQVLMAFGRRRPKDFLTTLDKFFVKREHRTQVLSLLCEFFRDGPPHLHLMLETPLFNNLLRCLQIDTSTTAVSLAITALTMFLPHIPVTTGKHLPSLFNIYARLLFWERERTLSPSLRSDDDDPEKSHDEGNEKVEEKLPWEKLQYSFESTDETIPSLLDYFTFLYGLYPINFMSYIRKPGRYLRHANFPGADDIEVQPFEIQQRSEPFRQAHLLHPNFFSTTIEGEITDQNRWMRSEAADVVASCMGLRVPIYAGNLPLPGPPPSSSLPLPPRNLGNNDDVPVQVPLSRENDESDSKHISTDAANVSWRNTMSTMVASPTGSRDLSGLARLSMQTTQSSQASTIDSPRLKPQNDRAESPTLPAKSITTSNTQLHDMLESQKSLRGNLQQSLPNESSTSVSSGPHHPESSVDLYLQSLAQHTQPSPSLRPAATENHENVAALHREIMLLKNDLNFERYLKQQHLSHIGLLRQKHVREATVEAETQNLINANRGLKIKLEEAKNTAAQLKKESEKSRAQSRKWEADLTAKLRALREEKKKWDVESEALQRDLTATKEECLRLRQLVIGSEARELNSKQKLQSVELDLDEIKKLQADVERLTTTIRGYEAQEAENERGRANEALAMTRLDVLEMRLKVRDAELEKTRLASEQEVSALRKELQETKAELSAKQPKGFQTMLDSALAVSRSRLIETQKAHAHLLKRFTALEEEYFTLQELHNSNGPLLSAGDGGPSRIEHNYGFRSGSPTPGPSRPRNRALSDPKAHDDVSWHGRSVFPGHSVYSDNTETSPRSSSGTATSHYDALGSISRGTSGFAQHGRSASVEESLSQTHSAEGEYAGGSGKKIKPGSEVRVYGRGGVQNIGKKEKEKKEKEKREEANSGDKKDRKGSGIRGIRAFV